MNPAFDVTPADLVTAIVTEGRVIRPAGSVCAGLPSPSEVPSPRRIDDRWPSRFLPVLPRHVGVSVVSATSFGASAPLASR